MYNDSLTPKFISNIGVKQGDTLSTILFNLYINDLPNIFSFDGNDPIVVGHTPINCLIYADDLVIMSTSAEGLQQCLNKLAIFFRKSYTGHIVHLALQIQLALYHVCDLSTIYHFNFYIDVEIEENI